MQFLLLGADAHALELLDTLFSVASPEAVVGWIESDSVGDQLATRFPRGNRFANQEEFGKAIAEGAVVVVGAGGDAAGREKLLRELARDSVPLILDQPACSGIFAVELDMIQRDTQAAMVPFHPPSHHPVLARLAQWTRGGTTPVGNIEQVVMERSLEERNDRAVRAELARDALILRRLLGNFQRVGAMPAKEIQSLSKLSVQLTGEAEAAGRWSIQPIDTVPGASITLVGEHGRLVLQLPDDGPWELSSTGGDIETEHLPAPDRVLVANSLLSAVEQRQAGENQDVSGASWEDAFRAADLADLACESVRRGKTLPVSNERLTEEDTFKSLMAAGGCLIILIIPFLLLLVSLFDGMDLPRKRSALLQVAQGQRTLVLPGDFEAIDSLKLAGDGDALPARSERQLFAEHGNNTLGRPAAYHLSRSAITFAPAADSAYEFQLDYEGSFRIWRGWPLLLLSPIVLFLILQLLKLAFPK